MRRDGSRNAKTTLRGQKRRGFAALEVNPPPSRFKGSDGCSRRGEAKAAN